MAVAFDRARGIGGSDVAAILGISPWRSEFDVYLEKTRDPAWNPAPETARMRLGKLLEPALRIAYEQDSGRHVLAHDREIWHTNGVSYAHLDGIVAEEGIWEGKSARDRRDWAEGVPDHYEAQTRQYLGITGEPWCDVTVLFLDTAEIEHYRVDADPPTDAGIITVGEDWWQRRLVERVPPEIDGSEGAARYLSAKHPRDPILEPALTAPGPVDEIGQQLALIRYNQESIKVARREAENIIKKAMGGHARIRGTGWSASWKRSKGARSIAWEEVATSYRAAIEKLRALVEPDHEDLPFFTDEALDVIVSLYTSTSGPGHPFVFREVEMKEKA